MPQRRGRAALRAWRWGSGEGGRGSERGEGAPGRQPSDAACGCAAFCLSVVHIAESEKRLIKKCRELNAEIVANAAKVQTALKLSEEDQSTISALKKEIEKAWKMVDASHEKEARAKETITQLKLEIGNLSRLVSTNGGASWSDAGQLGDGDGHTIISDGQLNSGLQKLHAPHAGRLVLTRELSFGPD